MRTLSTRSRLRHWATLLHALCTEIFWSLIHIICSITVEASSPYVMDHSSSRSAERARVTDSKFISFVTIPFCLCNPWLLSEAEFFHESEYEWLVQKSAGQDCTVFIVTSKFIEKAVVFIYISERPFHRQFVPPPPSFSKWTGCRKLARRRVYSRKLADVGHNEPLTSPTV